MSQSEDDMGAAARLFKDFAKDNDKLEDAILDDYIEWAIELDNLFAGTAINARTAEMGRTGDSISAEICYLLSKLTKDPSKRTLLIENGIKVATSDVEFGQDKGTKYSKQCSHRVLVNLEALAE